jgi:SAM-dependent methyltransferase
MSDEIGTGPGVITNDGCAVDFYALLPSFGEPEIVHGAIPSGASVLELGCGTGRILRPLAALGHPVTGVDDSPDMLAHLGELPTACGSIESVRLGVTFDVVLLASTLINVDPSLRRSFLATVREHLADGGTAVFQHNPPGWFSAVQQAPRVREDPGGITRTIKSARQDAGRVFMEVEYQVGDRVWTHSWGSYEIGEAELLSGLTEAGLTFGRYLTDDHAWFTAAG